MKVVFLALEFHLRHTKSSQFFIDILKNHFADMTVISVNDAWYTVPRIKPDVLIVWQHIFTPRELDTFGAKNVVLIPMYDACPHSRDFWIQYKKYKVFCFSSALYDSLKSWGLTVFYSQYFTPLMTDRINAHPTYNVLFWQRSRLISWHLVKNILGDVRVSSLHFHTASNINDSIDFPDALDVRKYAIRFTDWFSTRQEYLDLLKETDIFIAPRESEGIGLSFIEALSAGCCVVAPNRPTMNEYIEDGKTGLLYDPEHPHALDFSNIDEIRKNSLVEAHKKLLQWEESIPDITLFIGQTKGCYVRPRHLGLYLRKRLRAHLRHLYKKIEASIPVYIKLYGGLGNQLFQFSYGKYEESLGKKVRYILSPNGGHGKISDLTSVFHTNGRIFTPKNSFTAAIRKAAPRFLFRSLYTGFYQEYQYAAYLKTQDDFYFLRQDQYRDTSLFESIRNVNSVAVHIRGGDYLTGNSPVRYGNICTQQYYEKAAAYITSKIDNPRFFIFTDDVTYAEKLFPVFGNETIAVHDERFSSDPGFDLFLMKSCRHAIIANSTYSWWGAYLNSNGGIIIAPAMWIQDEMFNASKLIPPEWITL